MKRTFVNIFVLLFVSFADANDSNQPTNPRYIPQAPEAQAIARAIDIPVDYYTGVPNINIPLYEIKVGSISIPISLSYQGGGIRPNEEATWVGLGWKLNAGGAITRSVNSGDDFLEYENDTYSKSFFDNKYWLCNGNSTSDQSYYKTTTITSGNDSHSDVTTTSSLIADSEPDLFFYSFPGHSGKFMFKKDKSIVYVDKSANVVINPSFGKGDYYPRFYAIDANNNGYNFTAKETTRRYRVYPKLPNNRYSLNVVEDGFDCGDSELQTDGIFTYTSSWYLTEIVSTTNDTIKFEYDDENYELPISESGHYKAFSKSVSNDRNYYLKTGSDGPEYNWSKTRIDGYRLSKIIWEGGYVKFNADYARKDIKAYGSSNVRYLSSIEVYDKNSNLVSKWRFTYSYFNNDITGTKEYLFKRLKLTSLINSTDGSNPYNFTYYDSIPMPVKNTKNTDYWGYYNGVNQGTSYFCGFANKDANEEYTKIGVLKQIKHPTGGVTNFLWENNGLAEEEHHVNISNKKEASFSGFLETCDSIDTKAVHLTDSQTVYINLSSRYQGKDKAPNYGGTPFSIIKMNNDGSNDLLYSWAVDTIGVKYAKEIEVKLGPGMYQFRCDGVVKNVLYTMFFINEEEKVNITRENVRGISCRDGISRRDTVYMYGPIILKFWKISETNKVLTNTYPFSIYKLNDKSLTKLYTWPSSKACNTEKLQENNVASINLDRGCYVLECSSDSMACYYGDIAYDKMIPIKKNYLGEKKELNLYKGDYSEYDTTGCEEIQSDTINIVQDCDVYVKCWWDYWGNSKPTQTDEHMLWLYKKNNAGTYEKIISISESCIKNFSDPSREL